MIIDDVRLYIRKDYYEIGDPVTVISKPDYGTVVKIDKDGKYILDLAYQNKLSEPYAAWELGYNLNWNWCARVSEWVSDIGGMNWG